MNTNTAINYATALEISAILGKCTIKSVGTELLFPVIKLKSNLSVVVKQFQELREAICTESGLTFNVDGSVTGAERIEEVNEVSNALKKLSEDQTDIEAQSLKILSQKHLEDLYTENPALTTNELEVLLQLMLG
ncbi:hypothetical protein [Pedobacter steynii]|uniref:Uncharacterized protein n=1 Tax=Pedobacter steynii TaxID=430522 RepID=A0A1D7QBQ9_9SPHI|nr:hypothetical protein [Pedobacter steynii]AOM76004.1 hypothetical protein BFS30_01785 [Pedobacter steynii]